MVTYMIWDFFVASFFGLLQVKVLSANCRKCVFDVLLQVTPLTIKELDLRRSPD